MQQYERSQVTILLARLGEPPRSLIFVAGPRQTGKTTLVLQALRHLDRGHRYLPADRAEVPMPSTVMGDQEYSVPAHFEERNEQWLIRKWEEARILARDSSNGFVLVLDEIQKIKNWSETVKGLWDADRVAALPLHVVLLGSAPLLMLRGLSESLAGRFELIPVNHWTFTEMVEAFDFDIESYFYFGGYPGAAHLIGDQQRWRNYIRESLVEPNIEKDLLALARVDKPALLRRAFELGSAYSGQILSYTKMQGQLQDAGNTTTLAHYLELLSQAGLLAGLPKYAGQEVRKRGSSPKLNVLNTAFMSLYSNYSFEEAKADRTLWGRLMESTVGAHLFNTGYPDIGVYYWRKSPSEVDFVLERGNQLLAIEVKSAHQHKHVRGLEEFQKHFPAAKTRLVGVQDIPVEEFLSFPAIHWLDTA